MLGKRVWELLVMKMQYLHTPSGHFVQLQTHGAGVDKVDALLLSPLLKETDPGCQLSFSYFTNVAATGMSVKYRLKGLRKEVRKNNKIERPVN